MGGRHRVTESAFKVDLTNCDREPIHILGAIQPFGFLIALSSDWLISRVSANIAGLLGQTPEDLLGTALSQWIGAEAMHSIRNRMTMLRGEDAAERMFGIALDPGGRRYDIALHMAAGGLVLEFEPSPTSGEGDPTGTIRQMMNRLDQAETLLAFFREGARQVRALTGFDRVMVYRFDDTGSGEVVAEAARSGIGSFLGLHYPATDIPQQARTLYVRNIFRIIADVAATPVPIVPQINAHGAPLDLSLSVLRAVSPIHIEYLTNMGVGASLSLSIVIDGKLWGLFACHHYGARLPGLERRSVCELFGQMFAMKLESRERQAAADYLRTARDTADRLLTAVAGDASLLDDPVWLGETLSRVIQADGIGVWIDGRIALSGMTPNEAQFRALVRTLNTAAAGKVFSTDCISAIEPGGQAYSEVAAGMLALPISRTPRDYVVLFRQEIVRTVRWAGDPRKPVEYGPNGPRLTPRKSFEAWSELVRGKSRAFSAAETRVAETLRATLIEIVLRMSDQAHAERQLATERQDLLIAELNHRVRNILSLIRGLVRQSTASSGSLDDYIRDIDGRIHALARAHNQITRDHWGPASLRGLIETEAAAYLGQRADRVAMGGPEILLNPHAFSTLALVLHELMTNSAKYGGLSDSGRIDLRWDLDEDGDLGLFWRESGGPVVQAPVRQGFGSVIIHRSIPYDLGGRAEIRYALTGLEADFCIPARHIVRGRIEHSVEELSVPEPATDAITGAVTAQPLSGLTALLVEDSLIIAIDAEDILYQLGAARVLTAATIRQALEEIEREPPSIAMLDVNLGDQTSLPIADCLAARGIPFLFATGYGEQAALPPAYAAVEVLQKPYTIDGIAAALRRLTPR